MKRNTRTHRVLLVFRLIRFLTDDFEYGNGNSDPCRPAHMFLLSYLAMKRDKRHWRAVPQSHSTCFPRHSGILVKSPRRHSRQVSVMRSSSRPLRAVRTVPEQAVETSQWRGWHEAASCDVRTHDAESVTSVCSEHHCRMACSGAYRIFLAEEDWCCLQDSQVSPLRSHFSWKIPSWNCSAPQLFPRFGWT